MLKRFTRVAVVVVILALAVVTYVVWSVGGQGTSAIESWIGKQITSVTNAYITPRLSFDDLDYTYPATVRLKNLRLTAKDPTDATKTIDVLAAGAATIELAEVPSVGKPIVIEKVMVERPLVSVVSVEPGGTDFVGFANMMKVPDPSTPAPKVSEMFKMRLVDLQHATLVYDPRIAGTVPMKLEDVGTRLDIQPTADGWYKLATKLSKAPLFDLSIAGDVDLDDFHIRGLDLSLAARLGREYDSFLPPQLQQLLSRHKVKGELAMTLKGDVAIDDPMNGKLAATVKLTDANVAVERYQTPVKELTIRATLADRALAIPEFSMTGVSLTAQDPGDPAKDVVVFGLDKVAFTLNAVAALGEGGPLVFEKIVVDRPLIQAVSTTPGSTDFAGFTDLAKIGAAMAKSPEDGGNRPNVGKLAAKLSDIVQFRLIEVNDAKLVYDPRIAGTEAMVMDDIDTRLDLSRTDDGWYKLATRINLAPLFDFSLAGQLDLDTFATRELKLSLEAALGRENDASLPPQLQKFLIEHEVKGRMSLSASGAAPLLDPLKANLSATVHVWDTNVALGEYLVPVDDLNLAASFGGGMFGVTHLSVLALHGEMSLTSSTTFDEALTTDATFRVKDMVLQDTLRKQGAAIPKYSGRVNTDVTLANAPLVPILERFIAAIPDEPTTRPANEPSPENLQVEQVEEVRDVLAEVATTRPTTVAVTTENIADAKLPAYWGEGTFSIDEANIVNTVPTIDRFSRAVKKLSKADLEKPNERAMLKFTFGGPYMTLSEINYASNVAVARGKGTISVDQELNLRLNGGPLEKLQSLMGRFGKFLGKVTDAVSSYRIVGTLYDPQVRVVVAGGDVKKGASAVGTGVVKGAKVTGRGIDKAGKAVGGFLNKVFKRKGPGNAQDAPADVGTTNDAPDPTEAPRSTIPNRGPR